MKKNAAILNRQEVMLFSTDVHNWKAAVFYFEGEEASLQLETRTILP
jgi:hypothetical protein